MRQSVLILALAVALALPGCMPARAEQASATAQTPCTTGTARAPFTPEACARICTASAECGVGQRCRVVTPDGARVLAEDVADEILEKKAMIEAAKQGTLVAEQPACDGNCAPYDGDLTIRPSVPLAVCVSE